MLKKSKNCEHVKQYLDLTIPLSYNHRAAALRYYYVPPLTTGEVNMFLIWSQNVWIKWKWICIICFCFVTDSWSTYFYIDMWKFSTNLFLHFAQKKKTFCFALKANTTALQFTTTHPHIDYMNPKNTLS